MVVLRGRAASGPGQARFRAVAEALAGGLRERAVPEASLRSFAPALAHMLPGWFERTSDRAPEFVFLAEGVLLLPAARGRAVSWLAWRTCSGRIPSPLRCSHCSRTSTRADRIVIGVNALTESDEMETPT